MTRQGGRGKNMTRKKGETTRLGRGNDTTRRNDIKEGEMTTRGRADDIEQSCLALLFSFPLF